MDHSGTHLELALRDQVAALQAQLDALKASASSGHNDKTEWPELTAKAKPVKAKPVKLKWHETANAVRAQDPDVKEAQEAAEHAAFMTEKSGPVKETKGQRRRRQRAAAKQRAAEEEAAKQVAIVAKKAEARTLETVIARETAKKDKADKVAKIQAAKDRAAEKRASQQQAEKKKLVEEKRAAKTQIKVSAETVPIGVGLMGSTSLDQRKLLMATLTKNLDSGLASFACKKIEVRHWNTSTHYVEGIHLCGLRGLNRPCLGIEIVFATEPSGKKRYAVKKTATQIIHDTLVKHGGYDTLGR